MKRNLKLIGLTLLALLSLSLTSCDDDDDEYIAETLIGTWQGSLGSYYYTNYAQVYSSWYTEFRFDGYYADGESCSGRGVQIDYDPSLVSDYVAYPFTWYVQNGDIILDYDNGDEFYIDDYVLSDDNLTCTLRDANGDYIADMDLGYTSYWPWSTSYAKSTRAAENNHLGVKRTLSK